MVRTEGETKRLESVIHDAHDTREGDTGHGSGWPERHSYRRQKKEVGGAYRSYEKVGGARLLERAGPESLTRKDSAKQLEHGGKRGQNFGEDGA